VAVVDNIWLWRGKTGIYILLVLFFFEGLTLVIHTTECVVFCAVATHLGENVLPLTGMWCLWSECVGSQNVCTLPLVNPGIEGSADSRSPK
jgi:hypothetical protein